MPFYGKHQSALLCRSLAVASHWFKVEILKFCVPGTGRASRMFHWRLGEEREVMLKLCLILNISYKKIMPYA